MLRVENSPQPYVAPTPNSEVTGTEGVGGGRPEPKVVDRPPPRYQGRKDASGADGLPPPRMSRNEALAEFSRIEQGINSFDFSQPLTESSFAQMAAFRDQLMALMLKLRSSEMGNRDLALQTMIKERLAGIQKGLDAAKKELAASLINGIAQVGGGLISAGGGVKALRGPKAGVSAGGTDATGSAAWSQAVTQVSSGRSQVVQGLGTMAAAPLTYFAKEDDAEKARRDLDADVADKNYNQSIERMNKFLDDFKAQLQAEQQAWDGLTQSNNRVFT